MTNPTALGPLLAECEWRNSERADAPRAFREMASSALEKAVRAYRDAGGPVADCPHCGKPVFGDHEAGEAPSWCMFCGQDF